MTFGATDAITALANSGPKERKEAFDALVEELHDTKAALAAERARAEAAEVAADVLQKDVFNLTEKVIPNIRAERDRLRAAIEQAPHEPHCRSHKWFYEERVRFPCNCWKRAALEAK